MGDSKMLALRTGLCLLALALVCPIAARAENPNCERDTVAILYNWGNELKAQDAAGKTRSKLDAKAKALETSGFFRRCGELKTKVLGQMDLVNRLSAERLVALMKVASPLMTLKDFEKAILQNSTNPGVPNSDKCHVNMNLCRQNYDAMFKAYRDIGGPQFFEARCVTGKDKGAACDNLRQRKSEGTSHNSDAEEWISKHAPCKELGGACTASKLKEFKAYLQKIFERNTHTDPQTFEHAVSMRFTNAKNCREKIQAQKDIPDSTISLNGTAEEICAAIYLEAIKKKKQDACAKGEVNSECPAKTNEGQGGRGDKPNCGWGVADPPECQNQPAP